MRQRRLFVAGSTGATGRVLVPTAKRLGLEVVPHVRPKTAAGSASLDPAAAVLELSDHAALVEALRGCTTVVQLIGTMRKRFATGDTYELSDIGTTRQLVDAAKEAGCDHVVLLSSFGAGKPVGAYLKAKARAEALVTGSGLDWTILRPSAFEGGGHKPPPGMRWVTETLGLDRYRPITLDQLAQALLFVAAERAPLGVALEGTPLWQVVDEATARFANAR